MAINKSLEARLNSVLAPDDIVKESNKPFTNEPSEGLPVQQNLEFPEYEQTAGLLPKLFQKGAKAVDSGLTVEKALKPLTTKGVRLNPEPKIVPDPPPVAPAPVAVQPKAAKKPNIAPVPAEKMLDLAAERQQFIDTGTARAGRDVTPINTMSYDNDEFAATVRSASEMAVKNYPTKTVAEIRAEMIEAGVHESTAARILQGLPLESRIGDSEVAKATAGVIEVASANFKILDDLIVKLKAGELDQRGQLELRQQMAYNQVILQQMKGVAVDVGRAVNMFKGVKQFGDALPPEQMRILLDEAGGEEALLRLADYYLSSPTRKGKNRLLEAGLGKRMTDIVINTWQSNLLTDVAPHAYSLVSGLINTARAPVERMVAIGVGKIRESGAGGFKIINDGSPPSEYATAERYYMEDVQARMSGIRNGMYDAWITLARGGPVVNVPFLPESNSSATGNKLNCLCRLKKITRLVQPQKAMPLLRRYPVLL